MRTSILAVLLAAPTAALADHRHAAPPPPEGRVVVTNRSGGTVVVRVGAERAVSLTSWQTATVSAPAGELTVRATYSQFGATHTADTDRVFVDPRRTTWVSVDPEDTARILVTNESPFRATLEVNDRYSATLEPFASRVVTAPIGDVELDLLADGRLLDHTRIQARAFVEHRWTVHRQLTGSVVAVNPFPMGVEFVDARGNVRAAEPYGRVVYADLPAGSFRIEARRVTNEPIDSGVMSVSPGRTSEWRPEAPRAGLVSVDNDHGLSVRLVVDGETVRTLIPDQDTRVALALGWHRVSARDERGRILVDTWIEVEPFDVARLDFGERSSYVADAHEHGASCRH